MKWDRESGVCMCCFKRDNAVFVCWLGHFSREERIGAAREGRIAKNMSLSRLAGLGPRAQMEGLLVLAKSMDSSFIGTKEPFLSRFFILYPACHIWGV